VAAKKAAFYLEEPGNNRGRSVTLVIQSRIAEQSKDLAELAREINEAHEAQEASARTSLGHARRAGELLRQAKADCKRRREAWRPWVEKNCHFSLRTAQAYMQVARDWDKVYSKAQPAALFTLKGALRRLASSGREDDRAPEQAGAATPGGGDGAAACAKAQEEPGDRAAASADAPAPQATAEATPAGEPVVAAPEPGAEPGVAARSIDATPADRPSAAAEQEAAPKEEPVPAAVAPRPDRDEITVDIRASREEFPRALAEALLRQLGWGRANGVIQEVLSYFYDVDPSMCGSAQDG
jgi:hypothetical protein